MENIDLSTIIYIAIAIISILAGSRKKKKNQPQRPTPRPTQASTSSPQNTPRPKRPSIFDELLRELEELNPEIEKPRPAPVPVTREPEYEEEYGNYESDYRYQDEASSLEGDSFEETEIPVTTADSLASPDFERLESFKMKKNENPYRALFSNPKNVKQAIIISEIINRKY